MMQLCLQISDILQKTIKLYPSESMYYFCETIVPYLRDDL